MEGKKILEFASKTLSAVEGTEAKSAYSEIEDAPWEIQKIFDLIDNALDSGQSMEDRLTDYGMAIDKLGFIKKVRQ